MEKAPAVFGQMPYVLIIVLFLIYFPVNPEFMGTLTLYNDDTFLTAIGLTTYSHGINTI